MIERTPQEIADFFGCYVAQDECGEWWVYENKPILKEDHWMSSNEDAFEIEDLPIEIEVPEDHVWTKPYSPNVSENPTGSTVSEMEKVVGISEKETTKMDSAKIAQTSDSYVVVYYDCLEGLTENVNAYLSEGYLLCGNLVVDNSEYYQPMIKYQ